MKKSDEQIKREFDVEVKITLAIQAKGEALRKARRGTAKYRDALTSIGLSKCRTITTRCYAYGLEKNRPEHYQRFLEDEEAMLEYAAALEAGDEPAPAPSGQGNVIYGAFRPFSQKNEKAGISQMQKMMREIGIVPVSTVLRRVK